MKIWFAILFLINASRADNNTKEYCKTAFPCSSNVAGNLLLVALYGGVLAGAAKMISDGAEMLLDAGLPATLIGGAILPILGAVPDAAMILVSGLGDREEAQKQIDVGMGTLAGSTIMLLTIAWGLSLLVGKVDLIAEVEGGGKLTAVDNMDNLPIYRQGVEVDSKVKYVAIGMLFTSVSYVIIQTNQMFKGIVGDEEGFTVIMSLVALECCSIFFCIYIGMQIYDARRGNLPANVVNHREKRREQLLLKAAQAFVMAGMKKSVQAVSDAETERAIGKATIKSWKLHTALKKSQSRQSIEETTSTSTEASSTETQKQESSLKVLIKSIFILILGVGLVSFFSDPMCDALTDLTDKKTKYHIPVSPFYVSYIITPICSNASELLSSLIFAMKKKKENISLTYSQIYGAVIMNNTLCLGMFCALIAVQRLSWKFTAEVSIILLCEFTVGILVLCFRRIYYALMAFPLLLLYCICFFMAYVLENIFGLK